MSEVMPQDNGPHFRGPFLDEFKVCCLIPSMGQWHVGFAMSLIECMQSMFQAHIGKEQSFAIRNVQSSLIQYSREQLVHSALNEPTKWTHFLFLDSDMVFPHDTIHWLAYRQKPIVIANYVRRAVPAIPVTRDLNWKHLMTRPEDSGLQPVNSGGLGVALLEREVFEQVPRPWFDTQWRDSGATPGRPSGIPVIDGEDVCFFKQCRERGIDVLVDHDLSKYVKHIGSLEYTMAMADPADWAGEPEEGEHERTSAA